MLDATNLTVLLVDDDPEQREYLSHKFLHHGCKILHAGNPNEALNLVKKHQVDIVVSDFLMPGGKETGVELLQLIANLSAKRPVMVLTTGFVEFLPDKTFNLDEIAVVFTKPFDAERLVNTAFERLNVKTVA